MSTSTIPNTSTSPACPLRRHAGNSEYEDGMAAFATCDMVELQMQRAAENQTWIKPLMKVWLFRAVAECALGTHYWNKSYIKLPLRNYEQRFDTSVMPFHFRLSYLTLTTVLASLVTFLFGAALSVIVPKYTWIEAGGAMLMIAGTGWLVQGLLAYSKIGTKKFEYLSHMATVMWLGVLPLLPAALLLILLPNPTVQIPLVAVAFSSLMMLRQHFVRMNALQASQVWTLSWLLALQSTAWFWIFVFIRF